MTKPSNQALERVRVREVAGIFRTRTAIEAAIDELLAAGFDRADIDLMASVDAIRERFGTDYLPVEDLADSGRVPRRAYVAREDAVAATSLVAGVLSYVGATAAALGVVASGGTLAVALAAAAASGALTGGVGVLIARSIGRDRAEELDAQIESGGLVLWVRVRSAEREDAAQQILRAHGAEAVRAHEIDIEKHLDDIPLSSLRPDPWLGDERLGQV